MRTCINHFLLLAFFLFPAFALAQSASLSLTSTPTQPEVGQDFTLKAAAQGVQLPRTNISWFLNGSEITQYENQDTITLTAEDTASRITARMTFSNGTQLEAHKTISPTRIDLHIDAQTLTPPFFKGRNLPTSGSKVTATALVFKDNIQIHNNHSYVWKIDNKVQNGGALRGQNTFSFTPNFEKEVTLSVEVFDGQNKKIAQEVRSIPIADPELYFYQVNPLRGLMTSALNNPYLFIGDEMRIRAEVYYMNQELSSAQTLKQWQIDGKTVPSADNAQEIVVQKKGSGSASLSFHLRDLNQLLHGVKDAITLRF